MLDFFIDGSVAVECDRCLDEFNLQVTTNQRIIVKFHGDEAKVDKDDPNIIFISPKDDYINVAQFIYEFINLSIPIKKTCEMDRMGNKKCNEEMLKYLKDQKDKDDSEDDQEIDPRWNKLKDIKNN